MPTSHKSSITNHGFTLIEILVVLVVFAFIGLIVAQSVISTLRGAAKADSDARVRSNLDYVSSILDRHLRNAVSVSCPAVPPPALPTRVDYIDQRENPGSFYLNGSGADRHIASGSALLRVSADDVTTTTVEFTCNTAIGNNPPSVTFTITLEDRNQQGVLKSSATTTQTINLRTNL